MKSYIEAKAKSILEDLCRNENLGIYIDPALGIPQAFRGEGQIKLIFVGQDPTIQDATKRQKIDMVLNLNKRGSAGNYLSRICQDLGIERKQNIYATNLFKNFFKIPPTEIEEPNLFQRLLTYWLPLLIEELEEFQDVPVITLGEPVLKVLLTETNHSPLQQHWGYQKGWQKTQTFGYLKYVKADANRLQRILFPFPHLRTSRKEFYQIRMNDYLDLIKTTSFSKYL